MIKLNFLISLILRSKTWKPLCFSRIRCCKCDIYVLKYWWSASSKLNEMAPFQIYTIPQSFQYKFTKLIRACFLLRFWWAKFICLYSGHWFPPIYGYRRSFSQIFKNKEANLGGKPYHVIKYTIQNLWLKYEGCHYLVNVPVLTRSWKKVAPKKCKWQIKCVQLWNTLCNNF